MEGPILPWPSLGHLLEAAAREHGEKPLFVFEGESLSFDEVNLRVNRVANGLRTVGVAVAAVVPVPDPMRGEEVKAYLLLREGASGGDVEPAAMIDFARERLAHFKAPRYIEFVDELPRTPSERVEKHKLIEGKEDLRLGSFDAERETWITEDVLRKIDGSEAGIG